METPDKIYTSPNIENRMWLIGKADIASVEYIRKNTLLELLREKRKAITECSATKERKVSALSVIDFLIDKISNL